jgi:hypothetical protein
MCWNALHVEKQRKVTHYGDMPKREAVSDAIMTRAGAHFLKISILTAK